MIVTVSMQHTRFDAVYVLHIATLRLERQLNAILDRMEGRQA